MAHAHGGGHDHGGHAAPEGRLAWAVALTLAFVAGEAAAGWWANSVALLADAGHNFADALALAFSWFAVRLARRPPDARRTYGFHRAGVLAALTNAVSLVVIALVIFWEAARRLRRPGPVAAGPMVVVALAAVALNAAISLWLRAGARHDLNVRSAYLHMVGDAVSAAGVVAAGALVALTGWYAADPAVSLGIGALILWSSWGVLAESVDVLMEAAPAGLDTAALEEAARGVGGVRDVHDLHVWTVTPGLVACSCHVVVGEQSVRDGQQILRAVAALLRDRFGVAHATIQVEAEHCGPDERCPPAGAAGGAPPRP